MGVPISPLTYGRRARLAVLRHTCRDRRNRLYFNGDGCQPVAASDAETIRASGDGPASSFRAQRPWSTRPWSARTGRSPHAPGTAPHRPGMADQGDPGSPPAQAWDGSRVFGAGQAPCQVASNCPVCQLGRMYGVLLSPLLSMTSGISPNPASGARWQPLATYYPGRPGFSVLGGNLLRHSTSPIELRNSSKTFF